MWKDILLIALVLLPYGIHLGTPALWDANEAFYVEGPREMQEAGDWLTPRFNFAEKLNKPILSYWLVLISFRLFGVSAWAERVVIVSCVVIAVALTYGIGRHLFGPRVALWSALILATSPRIILIARRSLIDALLLVTVTAALFLFIIGWRTPRERASCALAYAMMGLGVLAKGLLGLILPLGTIGLFLLTRSGWDTEHPGESSTGFRAPRGGPLWGQRTKALYRDLKERWRHGRAHLHIGLGALILLGITAPWFLLMAWRHGWDYLSAFFIGEHVSRYLHGTHGARRPFWYYVPTLLGEFAPWSFFLPLAFTRAGMLMRSPTLSGGGHAEPLSSAEGFRFVLIWFLFGFVFFSFSSAKQNEYLVPLYPAVSLLVASLLVWTKIPSSRALTFGRGFHIALGVLSVAFVLGAFLLLHAARVLFPTHVLAYGPAILLLGSAVGLMWMGRPRRALRGPNPLRVGGVLVVTVALLHATLAGLLPEIERYRPVRPLAERIRQQAGPDDLVGYYRFTAPSLCFYTRRKIFEAFSVEEMRALLRSGRRLFCLMSEREYRDLSLRHALPLRLLECRPSLFPLRMRSFLRLRHPEDLERVCLVTTRAL